MRGVTFGTKHSYWNWRLMLRTAPKITSPQPKTKYVDIPGSDGRLDLSEMLTGKVQYKNRKIDLTFVVMAGREEWSAIYSDILNDLHGQVKEIRLDDDPTNIYTGRVSVGDPEMENKVITLRMTADVEPYKKTADGRVML